MNQLTQPVLENAIVFGGKQLPIAYRPTAEFPEGRTELVTIPLLEINPRLAKYLTVALQEIELAEFILERPAGWAKTLMPDSLLDIAETAHALNFTNARRWAEHRAKVAATLAPLNQRLESAQAKPSPAAAPASV